MALDQKDLGRGDGDDRRQRRHLQRPLQRLGKRSSARPEEQVARDRGDRGQAEDGERGQAQWGIAPSWRRSVLASPGALPAWFMTSVAATAAAIATRMLSFSGSENAATAAAAETIAATQAVRSLSIE